MSQIRKVAGQKKIRKLFHLNPEEAALIKRIATKRNISESEVVRISLRKLQIEENIKYDPLEKLVGTINLGNGHALQHDEVLYE